jgi:hypothetical protein
VEIASLSNIMNVFLALNRYGTVLPNIALLLFLDVVWKFSQPLLFSMQRRRTPMVYLIFKIH